MNQHSNRMAADALDADGFGASFAPPAQQHLVVETRTDDRWRVALCTTLDDLDAALDTARALRADPDVDEVCLTLETAGSQGRESRREVIRLGHEDTPALCTAPTKPAERREPAVTGTNPAMDALLPIIKAPDYTIDEEVLDALEPQPEIRTEYAPERAATTGPRDPEFDAMDDAPSEAEARAAARALVNSLYGLSGDPDEGRTALPPRMHEDILDFTDILPASAADVPISSTRDDDDRDDTAPAGAATRDAWMSDLDRMADGGWANQSRLEAEDELYDAAARLERPLIGDPSGVATKTFIVAGTLAMMVLGGALAELMSLDITATAEAGIAFDRPAAVSLPLDQR